jgi:tetratricopeptide (TPR) repeat protein
MLHRFTQKISRLLQGGKRRKLVVHLILVALSLLTTVTVVPTIAARATLPSPVSSTASTASPNPQSLLDQGRAAYEAGQLTQALTHWQQAVQTYAAQGQRLDQSLALSYVALVQQDLGRWDAAKEAIARSLSLIEQVPGREQHRQAMLAHILNTHASLRLSMGQSETALSTWEQAEAAYQQAGDSQGALGAQLNQVEALQAMGMFRRAQDRLQAIQAALQQQPSPSLRASGLRSLGRLQQATGNLPQAQLTLEQSLSLTQQLNQPLELGMTFSSLGNIYQALGQSEKALAAYEQAATAAPDSAPQMEAQLNQLALLTQLQRWQAAQTLFQSGGAMAPTDSKGTCFSRFAAGF